jgi:hypothetical protein
MGGAGARGARYGGEAMKFFVPHFDAPDAERVWAGTRLWLSELGLPTTRRRIRALACEIDGKDHFLAVGGDTPDGEDFVMAILEASNLDLFYVCTPSRGLVDDIPYPLALDEHWRVIDFDEEVCGHA